MRPKGGWSASDTQNMQASIGQYSIQAGEPAQPVQQSVVMARMRGFFLRVALPSPTDIGHSFSTISNKLFPLLKSWRAICPPLNVRFSLPNHPVAIERF